MGFDTDDWFSNSFHYGLDKVNNENMNYIIYFEIYIINSLYFISIVAVGYLYFGFNALAVRTEWLKIFYRLWPKVRR